MLEIYGEQVKKDEIIIFPFRHYPDRFYGFDLSPFFSGTPFDFGTKLSEKLLKPTIGLKKHRFDTITKSDS